MKYMSICCPKASVTFCSSSLIFSGLWNGMILGSKERWRGQRSDIETGVHMFRPTIAATFMENY